MAVIKDVPGMWFGENESAKFWLSIMNELRNRGIEDTGQLAIPYFIEIKYKHFTPFRHCFVILENIKLNK